MHDEHAIIKVNRLLDWRKIETEAYDEYWSWRRCGLNESEALTKAINGLKGTIRNRLYEEAMKGQVW
jgi:hypothetical protein